jgi:hypothetical protein
VFVTVPTQESIGETLQHAHSSRTGHERDYTGITSSGRADAWAERDGSLWATFHCFALVDADADRLGLRVHRATRQLSERQRHSRRSEDVALHAGVVCSRKTGGTIGYFLIGMHAAVALFHHYVIQDNTLTRMLPGHE